MNLLASLSALFATVAPPGSFGMPPQASTIAPDIDAVFSFINWLCIFFFILIVGVMLFFVVKYRRREGVPAVVTATHNTALEVTWTVIPLILVVILFTMGMKSYLNLREIPQNAMTIRVTAQKWSWTFNYDNGASVLGELVVPVNKPVKLVMTSNDLIHSLFIPAFRVKQDVVPGRYNYLWFEATVPGSYDLFCTEYCGKDHSQMLATVIVLPQEEYEAEILNRANWIKDIPDEQLHLAGMRIYARCKSCHSLDGSTGIAPSFSQTHSLWGKERVMKGGGRQTVDEQYILSSLADPQGDIVENFTGAMPRFVLKDREVRAIIEFIRRLDEVVDKDGNPRNPDPLNPNP